MRQPGKLPDLPPVLAEKLIRYAIGGACGKLTRDDSFRPICNSTFAIFADTHSTVGF
jgi:hypothetical protein